MPVHKEETAKPWTSPARHVFGARLRGAREARGLSQEELATALNKAAPYISQIESGRRIPSDELCLEMAKVLPDALDWDAVRLEADNLRSPQKIVALRHRSDRAPAILNEPLYHEFQRLLADDRLPRERREHLIHVWMGDIEREKAKVSGAMPGHRIKRGRSPAGGQAASAATRKGSR